MLVNRLIPIAVHCLDPTCSYISREVHVRLRCRVLEEFVVSLWFVAMAYIKSGACVSTSSSADEGCI